MRRGGWGAGAEEHMLLIRNEDLVGDEICALTAEGCFSLETRVGVLASE